LLAFIVFFLLSQFLKQEIVGILGERLLSSFRRLDICLLFLWDPCHKLREFLLRDLSSCRDGDNFIIHVCFLSFFFYEMYTSSGQLSCHVSVLYKFSDTFLLIIHYFFIFIKGILLIFHKIMYTKHITWMIPGSRYICQKGNIPDELRALSVNLIYGRYTRKWAIWMFITNGYPILILTRRQRQSFAPSKMMRTRSKSVSTPIWHSELPVFGGYSAQVSTA